jgi:hypothetical protein
LLIDELIVTFFVQIKAPVAFTHFYQLHCFLYFLCLFMFFPSVLAFFLDLRIRIQNADPDLVGHKMRIRIRNSTLTEISVWF